MPFTPTHVLAIVPIAAVGRGLLPFSALAIGSMVPDFPLFVPLSPDYPTTHSVPGLFTACLPLGMACFLLFQFVMKRPLFALLPVAVQRRCVPLSRPCVEPTLKSLGGAALAIVIGAATHVFWDSFTHRGRWGTRLLPQLNETALTVWGHDVQGFRLLQNVSSLIGIPVLALLLAIWLVRRRPGPLDGGLVLAKSSKIAAGLVVIAVPVVVALLVGLRGGPSRIGQLAQAVTTSGLALMMAALIYGLAFQAIEARRTWAK